MVQANIDNNPVSIQLSSGESVTVPSGETWKVTVTLTKAYPGISSGNDESNVLRINGQYVLAVVDNTNGEPASYVAEIVVTNGDTLRCDTEYNNGAGIAIQGFVVN